VGSHLRPCWRDRQRDYGQGQNLQFAVVAFHFGFHSLGQNFSGAPPQSIHLVIWFVQFQVSCFQFLAPLELETGNLKLP
jgi:hypothetical protein